MGASPTQVERVTPSRIGLVGADFPGLRLKPLVAAGDRVQAGEPLCVDRVVPAIRILSPVTGTVAAVHRGAARRLESILLHVEAVPALAGPTPDASHVAAVREALLAAGLWVTLRSRPGEVIPSPAASPEALYITATDTRPLALNPSVVLRDHRHAFDAGVRALAQLAPRTVVCTGKDCSVTLPDLPGLEHVTFQGPHPAGLVGTHIHLTQAPGESTAKPPEIWHIGYQDVIACGYLFADGSHWHERRLAVAGPNCVHPFVALTVRGVDAASLAAVARPLAGSRWISGAPLSGRLLQPDTAVAGWTAAQLVALPPAPAATGPAPGFLVTEAFERVWPLPIPVAPLLHTLRTNDEERFETLDCAFLAAEDLALCEYVCPMHQDYGAALTALVAHTQRGVR
ncbi:MAG: hypothetical protein H6993_11810 [Pseudomonadales bacterium]|nr:hypothetical protein [Pseudomonadales bacterium]MCP5184641.1 hypothetical protein [Pseudomonadales bacterium]